MKQILSVLILIAELVSLGVGGTFAHWVDDSDSGDYAFEAGEWQVDLSGTIGFWKGPGALNAFNPSAEDDIEFWLREIDTNPGWLGPTEYDDMVLWLSWDEPGEASSMEAKFLAQYLAQRLNQRSGRQSESTQHDVTKVPSYDPVVNYLGLANPYSASGAEIIQKIELKYNAILPPPTDSELEIMKDVCDWLNNLWM